MDLWNHVFFNSKNCHPFLSPILSSVLSNLFLLKFIFKFGHQTFLACLPFDSGSLLYGGCICSFPTAASGQVFRFLPRDNSLNQLLSFTNCHGFFFRLLFVYTSLVCVFVCMRVQVCVGCSSFHHFSFSSLSLKTTENSL